MPLRLTLYFPYYNQDHQLKRLINYYNSFEFFDKKIHELVQFVIIDDGSMLEPIQSSSFANFFYAHKIHRINKDVPWNMPEANNLAFEIAETNHVLRTDIDHFFPIETLIYILENLPLEGVHLKSGSRVGILPDGTKRQCKHHPNTYVVTKDDYWKCGGSNEFFSGCYGDDQEFIPRLEAISRPIVSKDFLSLVNLDSGSSGLERNLTEFRRRISNKDRPFARFAHRQYYQKII